MDGFSEPGGRDVANRNYSSYAIYPDFGRDEQVIHE